MSKTVKVFFSQPMHGLTDEEIKRERSYMMSEFRDYIINELGLADDVVVIDVNRLFDIPAPADCGRLWYLGRSIQMMDEADYIVFHKDFDTANGCKVEHLTGWNYFKWQLHSPGGFISDHISRIFMGNTSHDS